MTSLGGKQIMRALVFFLLSLNLEVIGATEITKTSINTMILKVEQAVEARDIQRVADTFSDDVKIIRHIVLRGEKLLEEQSKQEYLQMLVESWSILTNYEFSRTNTEISIEIDQALVISDVEEYATFKQQRMKSTSRQEVTIKLVRGTPLITKMVSYINVEDIK